MNTHTHRTSHRAVCGTACIGAISTTVLVLCVLVCFSSFSFAIQRYTVNRPVTTTTPFDLRQAEPPEYMPKHTAPIPWETDYEHAVRTAQLSSRCLLIYIGAENTTDIPDELAVVPLIPGCREFDRVVLDDDFVRGELGKYVLLKLPMNAEVVGQDGTKQSIYVQPGFEHMLELPGLVVIDFAQRDKPYYGEVTGILPFLQGECPTPEQVAKFLDLPPGTLTQRTLTYAVRIHPDNPLSSDGEPLAIVVKEAAEHAQYQADRGVLTHQNFGVRSNRVKEVLGAGAPAEICAQSRSESLFEAALSCMRLWRYSSAHWSIARKSHTYYGYDMARSKNGSWYGVGFFINTP